MNIDVHYYATLTAARIAGLSDDDARLLANCCYATGLFYQHSEFTQLLEHTHPMHSIHLTRETPNLHKQWSLDTSLVPHTKLDAAFYPFQGMPSNMWDVYHGHASLFEQAIPKVSIKAQHGTRQASIGRVNMIAVARYQALSDKNAHHIARKHRQTHNMSLRQNKHQRIKSHP